MNPICSGEIALTATADGWNPLLPAIPSGQWFGNLVIINEGSAPGFFSADGNTSLRLPVGTISMKGRFTGTIQFKRVNGGSNIGGLYAFAF